MLTEKMVLMTKGAFLKTAAAVAAGCAGAVAAVATPSLAQGLPNGNGKELVRMTCSACHDLSPITGAGFSRQEWETVVRSMIDMGAVIRPEDVTVIVNYLTASFPPKGKQ